MTRSHNNVSTFSFRFNIFSITNSNEVMPEKRRIKSLRNSDVNKKFLSNKLRRLCSVVTCDNASQRKGLCLQHLSANRNRQQPTKTIAVSRQSSSYSDTEESDISSNNSPNALVTLTQNLTEPNTFDKYSERFDLKKSLVYKIIFHFSSYRKHSKDTDSNTFN